MHLTLHTSRLTTACEPRRYSACLQNSTCSLASRICPLLSLDEVLRREAACKFFRTLSGKSLRCRSGFQSKTGCAPATFPCNLIEYAPQPTRTVSLLVFWNTYCLYGCIIPGESGVPLYKFRHSAKAVDWAIWKCLPDQNCPSTNGAWPANQVSCVMLLEASLQSAPGPVQHFKSSGGVDSTIDYKAVSSPFGRENCDWHPIMIYLWKMCKDGRGLSAFCDSFELHLQEGWSSNE